MGVLVPPRFDDPNFQKIMLRRIKWLKIQLYFVLVLTVAILGLVVITILGM